MPADSGQTDDILHRAIRKLEEGRAQELTVEEVKAINGDGEAERVNASEAPSGWKPEIKIHQVDTIPKLVEFIRNRESLVKLAWNPRYGGEIDPNRYLFEIYGLMHKLGISWAPAASDYQRFPSPLLEHELLRIANKLERESQTVAIEGNPKRGGSSPIWANQLDDLISQLRKTRKALPARLLEFMRDKKEATIEDAKAYIWGDQEREDKALTGLVSRTNEELIKKQSHISFNTGSGWIHKNDSSPKGG